MKVKQEDLLVDLLEVARKLIESRNIPDSELKGLSEACGKFMGRNPIPVRPPNKIRRSK